MFTLLMVKVLKLMLVTMIKLFQLCSELPNMHKTFIGSRFIIASKKLTVLKYYLISFQKYLK